MKYIKLLAVLLVAGLMAYGFMFVNARIVQVKYTDVYLRQLPQELDGTKLLYVSDIHITSEFDVRRTRELMNQLQYADADLLLLGGDYTDVRLWRQLPAFGDEEQLRQLSAEAETLSHEWMRSLANFHAPLGKFAVMGNHDAADPHLAAAMDEGGVQLLVNEAVTVQKNGAELTVAGVGIAMEDNETLDTYDPYVLAKQVPADACCVLLSHEPDALPQMFTIDSEGGAWIDLALCGHTHGGQVRFGNWVPINNSDYGLRYLSGWAEHVSGWSLTSNGLGTTGLPIRFGAPAQVHLITLHRSIPVE